MNAAQVRAKARMAMKKREEQLEDEEREGGELNLVPYLDIVTNIVVFLLAATVGGLLLGTINSTLPQTTQSGGSDTPPDPNEEQPVQLVMAVTKQEVLLFSLSGLEGTLQAPKVKIATPAPEPKGRDDDETAALLKKKAEEWGKITSAAAEIVKRRWGNRPMVTMVDKKPTCIVNRAPVDLSSCRPVKAPEVYLMVDGDIPYQLVIDAMDALRESPDGVALFPGVVFSSGVQ